jgi:hypothetical protein
MFSNDSNDELDRKPAMLDWFGQKLTREQEHRGLPPPMLDAILLILEYTPDRLKRGGFMDAWLTAALQAYSRIKKAPTELEPLRS